MTRRVLEVDGIRTGLLEAGDGPPLVLLHGGAPGDCAEASWERNLDALAARFRVIAPDWLGFGHTDKLFDFGGFAPRMLRHLARVLEALEVREAAFCGLSMGGTLLVRALAMDPPRLPATRVVLVSGGGQSPMNEARRTVQEYDGTLDGMRAVQRAVLYDDAFAADDDFVRRRHEWSLVPGAWEWSRALGLRSPAAPPPAPFGQADPTPYERVRVPVLITAGADDPLREPGWTDELVARLPDARASVYERCGHCPNLEHPDRWNAEALAFLAETGGTGP